MAELRHSYSLPPRRYASTGGSMMMTSADNNQSIRRRPPPLNRSLTRADSIRQAISTGTAGFFGVSVDESSDTGTLRKWEERRLRHCCRQYGGIKAASSERSLEHVDGTRSVPRIVDPLAAGVLRRNLSVDRTKAMPSPTAQRDSVAKMAWSGIATLVKTGSFRARTRTMPSKFSRADRPYSRSFTPSVVAENAVFEHEFGEIGITPTSATAGKIVEYVPMAPIAEGPIEMPSPTLEDEVFFDLGAAAVTPSSTGRRVSFPTGETTMVDQATAATRYRAAYRPAEVPTPTSEGWNWIIRRALQQADRHYRPKSLSARLFGRALKRLQSTTSGKSDDLDDFRPYFTYWITTVQILIVIVALAVYKFGPFGFSRTQYSDMIRHTSLVMEHVAYTERDNFWLGPRFADLVHLGAKYAPCMRKDENFMKVLTTIKEREGTTACCIHHDGTGCLQTTAHECPSSLATWLRWTMEYPGPGGRLSGTVCGQDPRECRNPASVKPFEWPDDITKWPVCIDSGKRSNSTSTLSHMSCKITGRPCCIGIQGECRITTREYCDFVRGYFHEEATLCSQVHCLQDVCGMIPFANPDEPNQFYRLLLTMFLHAGLFHLLLTVLVQYLLMRDLEKLIGWIRMSIIYLVSGIGGNLASCVFVPYEAEVGPAGAQFGLVAALFVDALYSWRDLLNPWKALLKLTAILIFLFILGLLPWVDNYAHLFGFIFGFLLSLALFPYIQVGRSDDRKRIIKRVIIVIVCLSLVVAFFAMLMVLFYVRPLTDCDSCVYFNCIPLTEHFCDNQGLTLQITPV